MLISADAFKIFDKDGVEVKFTKVVSQSLDNQIILFGELHNNPISHPQLLYQFHLFVLL